MTAELTVLHTGYADDRVASTVTFVRDADRLIVIDPGMVAGRSAILRPLADLGVAADDITDVVISHHHPDHTVNIALFPDAVVHDFMASYRTDVWTEHPPGDRTLSPSVRLLSTPGHTAEDISTAVRTAEGLALLTHLWWSSSGPADDPFAPDPDTLRSSRERILALAPALIVPGHGAPFTPAQLTIR